MAMPVIVGEKCESERFPGAKNTYCIESMMQDGRALQAGTSRITSYNVCYTKLLRVERALFLRF